MQINVTFDPTTVTAANFSGGAAEEAQFEAAVNYAANLFDAVFASSATLNLTVHWSPLPNFALAQNDGGDGYNYSYNQASHVIGAANRERYRCRST
jgi:hypothetical protein